MYAEKKAARTIQGRVVAMQGIYAAGWPIMSNWPTVIPFGASSARASRPIGACAGE